MNSFLLIENKKFMSRIFKKSFIGNIPFRRTETLIAFLFICLFFISHPINAVQPKDWGFSVEGGMSVPSISLPEMNVKSFHLDPIFEQLTDNSASSEGKSIARPDVEANGFSQLYHFGGDFFYNSWLAHLGFGMIKGKADTQQNFDTTSGISSDMLQLINITHIDFSFGYQWGFKGAIPILSLLAGVSHVRFSGLGGIAEGSTNFLTASIRLTPSIALGKNFDLGIYAEFTSGISLSVSDVELYGSALDSYFSNDVTAVYSANFMRYRGGIFAYMPAWGIFVRTGVEGHNLSMRADGNDQRISAESDGMAFWNFSIGYYFTRPHYNRFQ